MTLTENGPLRHVVFSQSVGVRRGDQVFVPGYHNGNLRAYGALVPGTVAVMPENRNLDLTIATPLDGSLEPVVLEGFTARDLLSRSLAYVRARKTIRKLIERAEFVQIQYPGALTLMAGRAAVAARKPFYVDMHGSLHDPPGVKVSRPLRARLARRLYYRPAAKRLAGSARLLIAVSPHLHQTFPVSDAPRVVAPCTLVEAEAIRRRDDACAGTHLDLFVATRMIESKGIHHLLQAMRILLDESCDVRLKVAGVGDYLPKLRQLAAELDLESNAEFLGGVPAGEPLWNLYRQADIVVLPSLGHYEGTPRMIIEAWAAGAPVIATAVGGIPAMVNDERDGLIVAPGDAAALAAAVKRVHEDSDLRRRLVANAYDRAATMTFDARLSILRRALEEHLPGLLLENNG